MIVVYHPAKPSPGDPFGQQYDVRPGHYFACDEPDCGFVGPIRTGERSRLAACEDARRHDVAKSMDLTQEDRC